MFKKQEKELKKSTTEIFAQLEQLYIKHNQGMIDSLAEINKIVKQMFSDSSFKKTPCYHIMKQIYYGELLRLTNVDTPTQKATPTINPYLPLTMQRKAIHMDSYPCKDEVTKEMLDRARTFKPPSAKWKMPQSEMRSTHTRTNKRAFTRSTEPGRPKPVLNKHNHAKFNQKGARSKIGRKIARKQIETTPLIASEQYMFKIGDIEHVMCDGNIYKITSEGEGEKIGQFGEFSVDKVTLNSALDQDGERVYLDQHGNVYDIDKHMVGVKSGENIYVAS